MTVDTCPAKTISPDEFRKGMRRLAASVNVISTDLDGELHGLLATAVCSVSDTPPTLLVCINKNATACTPIATSKRFCVSVLSEDQLDLAQKFLTKKSNERISLCKWQRLSTGAPAIESALVNFDCEVAQTIDSGTHTIYFGRIVAATFADEGAPLLYFDGKYAGTAPVTLR